LKKQILLSVLLLAIFAIGIVSMAVPVSALVEGDFTIAMPDKVVPGGALLLNFTSFSNPSGTTYFYLSEDDDAYISSGDKFITSMDTDDIEDELADYDDQLTVPIPSTVDLEDEVDYYVKITDRKRVDQDCIVSEVIGDGDDTVEAYPEEDWPTITVDPESGTYDDTFDVEGEDIDTDYDWASHYWDKYQGDLQTNYQGLMEDELGAEDFEIVDGEYSAEEVLLDEAYMGDHTIFVILYDETETWPDGTIGTFVGFKIEPSVDVTPMSTFSIEADTLDQSTDIYAHGFPDGTIDEDTIKYIVKDMEGDVVDTYTAAHDEVDIEDDPPGTFEVGGAALTTVVDEVEEGVIDLQFAVNGETITLEGMFYSSTDSDPGKFLSAMDVTSGEIGDDVKFYAIDFPAGVTVDVTFENDVSVSLTDDLLLILPDADDYGAWEYTFTLEDLPGGKYTVRLRDETNARVKTIGTFEVLPTVTFLDVDLDEIETAYVGDGYEDTSDDIQITGTAFPVGAVFTSIKFAGEAVDEDYYWDWVPDEFEFEVEEDGLFDSGFIEVPHISGGGKEVKVEIKGEDAEGDPLTIEAEITIDPRIEDVEIDTEEEIWRGVLVLQHLDLDPDPDITEHWESYLTADIFGGNPMKITGVGFLAGESVTVTFTSEDKDLEEKCLITSGGKVDSDGDLEVVFMLPHTVDFAKTIDDGDIEVKGSTSSNKDTVFDRYEWYGDIDPYVVITHIDDDLAKLFFGLEDDGDLDTTVYVGDVVRIVGVGFETKELTLEIEGDEVGTPTAKYGFFDTTITIPELERGEDYVVDETETVTESTEFEVESNVVLSPEKAVSGSTVTASGTGWADAYTVNIEWPDLPALVEDIEPDTGSWEETFTVPDVEPGTYTITFIDEDDVEVEKTFFVLGPLQIASLSMPTTVFNGSTITISITVKDYFGKAISGATVTGKITPPVGAAVSLTFPATDAAGVSSASWTVPATAAEGTYKVDVTAEKAEAGGKDTASGSFYVELKVPPVVTPPVDISKLEKSLSDLTGDVSGLASDVTKLGTDVSGLKSDIAALEEAIAAIPVVPVEWIYITAIMAIIAAIAAIAAVVAVYRKIA